MTKFEEEFNYLIELSGKVLIGQVDAEAFEKNRIAFFEKYETDQQQALPVVPEDVDEAIKYLKKHNTSTLSDLDDILTVKGFRWLNDFQFKDTRFGVGGLNNKLFILSHLAITGYQVEKPQLFKVVFPNSTSVLQKNGELNSFADTVYKRYLLDNAMTEQEIKSIDERYWQFAVPVEDGE